MKHTAVVIGSGPNGLAAAIVLAQAGLDVEVREAAPVAGGGARSGEITLPGFVHDLGSAVHPMAVASPFFSKLALEAHGLNWIWSPAALAHPLDDGSVMLLERNVETTGGQFGVDSAAYKRIFNPLVMNWPNLAEQILGPLRLPNHPVSFARFGLQAMQPATYLARSSFRNSRTRAFFAGLAAHSILKLEAPLSAAFGLIMGATGHAVGWPIPAGGAQRISDALGSLLVSLGGRMVTGSRVDSLDELADRDAILCDITPRQFLKLAGSRLPPAFRRLLERYQYGPGVFKVDWALREPIPWKAKDCLRAATVHLGGSLEEIAASERAAWEGRPPDKPFVLLAQPSLFDPTRAPAGQHTAWAYCHVPNGWPNSALAQIEAQIERFAPGFRECILARSTRTTQQMQLLNENLIGGDISGGAATLKQFFLRPTWRRYGTPLRGVYLCSSSTPPGGGVHGMCGYYAAQWALAGPKAKRS
jgi:phytoene dehydrogenase-like protein